MICFSIYLRQAIYKNISLSQTFLERIGVAFLYLMQVTVLGFLTMNLFASFSWNYLNQKTATTNSPQTLRCEVTRFWRGRNNSVDFKFMDHNEKFNVSNDLIRNYENEDPSKYELIIEAQKGLCETYLVKHWSLNRKK